MFASSIAPGWGCYGGVVIRSVQLLIIKVNDIFIFNSLCVLGGKQPKSTKTKSQLRVARSLVPESPVRVVGSTSFARMAGLPQLGAVTSLLPLPLPLPQLALIILLTLSLFLSLSLFLCCYHVWWWAMPADDVFEWNSCREWMSGKAGERLSGRAGERLSGRETDWESAHCV